MAILDAELQSLLIRKRLYEENPAEKGNWVDPEKRLFISIKFNGDIAEFENMGFQLGSIAGNFAFGATNLAGLDKLAADQRIERIDKQRTSDLQLDGSVRDIKANEVWSRSGSAFSGYTGSGVIVGIIDTGIDFKHKTFRLPDNNSRIIKIWDQTLTAQGGDTVPGPITDPLIALSASTPTPLGYGVEYDTSQINAALTSDSPPVQVRHRDTNGHGTHVAGIAVGDGSQNSLCHGEYTFIGVAPAADIMVVRLWGLTEGDTKNPLPTNSNAPLDAVKYLFNEAKRLNRPLVINCSFGLFNDNMDGSSSFCQACDQLLTGNSVGRTIVFAAGNDADNNFHANPSIPATGSPDFQLKFKIHSDDNKDRNFSIKYTGSNLQVRLISPLGGANGTINWVSANNNGSSNTANGSSNTTGGTSGSVSINNQPNYITINITPPRHGTAPVVNENNRSGTWIIELKSSTASPTPINAFCLFGSSHDSNSPYFLNNTTVRTTLTDEPTGKEILSVGSYREGGQLTGFSGRGPTLDSPPRIKPEICAPGEGIMSAGIESDRTEAEDYLRCACCCDCCASFYVDKSGTSMAAPHIAGLVALMFHRNPNLTHIQVKSFLQNNTTERPNGSSPDQIVGWGTGKANAKKTVLDPTGVPQVNAPVAMVDTRELLTPNLIEELQSMPYGKSYEAIFRRYFEEIYGLINANKRVATAWHRIKGPVWTRLAIKAFHQPDADLPTTLGELQLKESLERFSETLQEYATPELAKDLAQFEPDLRERLQNGGTLRELMQWLGCRNPEPDLTWSAMSVSTLTQNPH
jgi:subtilisin family serine protease